MKRTNFYFPDELLARIKAYAEANGTTSSEVIRTAVEEHLSMYEGLDDTSHRAQVRQVLTLTAGLQRVAAVMRKMSKAQDSAAALISETKRAK